MKKREFLKRLLGITSAAVVAPKVLLAEEEPKKVVVGDSRSFGEIPKPNPVTKSYGNYGNDGGYVEDVISCSGTTAEVFCKTPSLRLGDCITIKREGKPIGTVCMVTGFSKFPGEDMYRVRFRSAFPKDLDVKKDDFLEIKANAYAENSTKTKKDKQ